MTVSVFFQRTDVLTELERSKRVFMQESTNCARHMAWVSTLIFTKVRICVQGLHYTKQFEATFLVTKTSVFQCRSRRPQYLWPAPTIYFFLSLRFALLLQTT